jgi:hypothetical protein
MVACACASGKLKAMMAMRFAAGREMRALRFAPVALGAERARAFGPARDLADRIVRWSAAVEDGAARRLMALDRLAEWRRDAEARALPKLARRLLPLLHAAPALESGALARRLGVTPQYVNRALQTLAREGLAAETTGRSKYRLWRANLAPARPARAATDAL